MAVRQCQMIGWPATSKRGCAGSEGQRWTGTSRIEREHAYLGDVERERAKASAAGGASDLDDSVNNPLRQTPRVPRQPLTRITALVAPATPFDLSRWGICRDMAEKLRTREEIVGEVLLSWRKGGNADGERGGGGAPVPLLMDATWAQVP